MSTARDKINQLLNELAGEQYQKGWDDAVAHILAAARKGAPEARQSVSHRPAPRSAPTSAQQYDTPIIDMVLQIVNEKPGLRGIDVVHEIVARDGKIPVDVADRTGRTSLSRLHKRDKIIKKDQRWYPAPRVSVSNAELLDRLEHKAVPEAEKEGAGENG